MKPVISALIALAFTGAFVATVHAQSADRQIKYRQSVMYAQGYHFYGVLGDMAKGTRPYDKDVAVRSAKFIDTTIDMPWDGFTPGSETGAPTKAKPDIWKDKATFDKLGREAKVETTKLVSAAAVDLATLRTQVQATGAACKACHDKFRND
ncbi:MAG TPA: cytochrome c [Casimicrobiaceae bacterium]|nr:cytochrome c [Casimicrobiaceae bacterium]